MYILSEANFLLRFQTEIIYTVIALIALVILQQLFRFFVKRFMRFKSIDVNRRKVVLNLGYFMLYVLAALAAAAIWGFTIREFAVFASSILAVLGIGFFAQWSLLSNLTASVILFFSHPMRIGDRIRILDKDFDWTGKVTDITGFYLHMRSDKGEYLTFPTSLVLQKGVEVLEKES